MDPKKYAHLLSVTHPLRESLLREVIAYLQLPVKSHGLDAGCGIGLQILLLAEVTKPHGRITGLDTESVFLKRAEEIVQKAGCASRIDFKKGDIYQLPFDDATFDWVWSADCIGYQTENKIQLLKEIMRVVKPGGMVALLVWSSQMLLPGYPFLEARLNLTSPGVAPFTRAMIPEVHYLRTLGWFHDAGMKNCEAKTFVGDACAPLSDKMREAMTVMLHMRWEGADSEVSKDEWAEFQKLSSKDSPDFILDRSDYYAFFTYSLFRGTVP